MVNLILGDCFEVVRHMKEKIDAIITDPPYILETDGGGIMNQREFAKELVQNEIHKGFDSHEFLDLCLPLFETKQHFCGVFFCSNKQIHEYLDWAIKNDFQYGVGVWHKTNPAPLCGFKYLNDVEYWIYIKGKKSKILGNYHTKSMVYTSQVNKADKKLYNHPTIKPLEIIRNFVLNHSSEGQTVFDPFMGTGTTGVVCKELNRKFIGIESQKHHFDTAVERVDSHEVDKKPESVSILDI